MEHIIQFLLRHGYSVVFVWVFAEQVGFPVPSSPTLLAMGALAGRGEFSFTLTLALATAASLLSDIAWFELGRHRGHRLLNQLCRISLEPDSCVRRTENLFIRYGARSLLVAKFVPGLGAVASPLAGMFSVRASRFLLWDVAGVLAWAGTFLGLGYVFSSELERVAGYALRLGSGLAILVIGAFVAYVVWKYFDRQRFIHKLRIARITPEELKQKLDAGEDVVVVDLRSSMEFEAEAEKLPGALMMNPQELEARHLEIPRERDVILYCT
jgi:membrane protein DedA with SNARE-associated domain